MAALGGFVSVAQQGVVHPVAYHPSDYLMAHQEFSPSTDVQGAAALAGDAVKERAK